MRAEYASDVIILGTKIKFATLLYLALLYLALLYLVLNNAFAA
jgi:hypothetical protein